jgi:hypothetical protein
VTPAKTLAGGTVRTRRQCDATAAAKIASWS